jgi:hypothetical protein
MTRFGVMKHLHVLEQAGLEFTMHAMKRYEFPQICEQ